MNSIKSVCAKSRSQVKAIKYDGTLDHALAIMREFSFPSKDVVGTRGQPVKANNSFVKIFLEGHYLAINGDACEKDKWVVLDQLDRSVKVLTEEIFRAMYDVGE
jgi:CBS domain-containing protein